MKTINPFIPQRWMILMSAMVLSSFFAWPRRATASVPLSTYTFAGKATYAGKACSEAKIVIRLDYAQSSQVKSIVTTDDGDYSVAFKVPAQTNEGVLWSIEASRTDLPAVKLEGQRISMQEQDDVRIDRSIEFASLPSGISAENIPN